MQILNDLLPTYTYNYFKEDGSLGEQKLNIIQCFIRKFFGKYLGWYEETYLSNVVQQCYRATINAAYIMKKDDHAIFLQLFKKANQKAVYESSSAYYFNLTECDPKYKELKIGLSYEICTARSEREDSALPTYLINSINFKIAEPDRSCIVRIKSYNKPKVLAVDLSNTDFNVADNLSESELTEQLNGLQASAINQILKKCLIDSNITEFEYIAHDYEYLRGCSSGSCCASGVEYTPPKGNGALNTVYLEIMNNFSWQLKELQRDLHARLFVLNKKQLETNLKDRPVQKISLDFAYKYMAQI